MEIRRLSARSGLSTRDDEVLQPFYSAYLLRRSCFGLTIADTPSLSGLSGDDFERLFWAKSAESELVSNFDCTGDHPYALCTMSIDVRETQAVENRFQFVGQVCSHTSDSMPYGGGSRRKWS